MWLDAGGHKMHRHRSGQTYSHTNTIIYFQAGSSDNGARHKILGHIRSDLLIYSLVLVRGTTLVDPPFVTRSRIRHQLD